MLLFTTGYDADVEQNAIKQLIDLNVDGVILNLGSHSIQEHQSWLPKTLPKVYLFNDGEIEDSPSIALDNQKAMFELTSHLIALGHHNIVMLGSDFTRVYRYKMRAEGYRQAMTHHDLAGKIHIEEISLSLDDLSPALQRVLSKKDRPTAIICSHAQLLIKVHGELSSMDYKIPEDISLAGFNLYEMGKLLSPAVCSIDQSLAEIGEASISMLNRQIEGSLSDKNYYVQSDFYPRKSVKHIS